MKTKIFIKFFIEALLVFSFSACQKEDPKDKQENKKELEKGENSSEKSLLDFEKSLQNIQGNYRYFTTEYCYIHCEDIPFRECKFYGTNKPADKNLKYFVIASGLSEEENTKIKITLNASVGNANGSFSLTPQGKFMSVGQYTEVSDDVNFYMYLTYKDDRGIYAGTIYPSRYKGKNIYIYFYKTSYNYGSKIFIIRDLQVIPIIEKHKKTAFRDGGGNYFINIFQTPEEYERWMQYLETYKQF
jgi:hypothetical protein